MTSEFIQRKSLAISEASWAGCSSLLRHPSPTAPQSGRLISVNGICVIWARRRAIRPPLAHDGRRRFDSATRDARDLPLPPLHAWRCRSILSHAHSGIPRSGLHGNPVIAPRGQPDRGDPANMRGRRVDAGYSASEHDRRADPGGEWSTARWTPNPNAIGASEAVGREYING
jgi:hypothetical protein